jgi:hypothetical protein
MKVLAGLVPSEGFEVDSSCAFLASDHSGNPWLQDGNLLMSMRVSVSKFTFFNILD